MLIRLLYYYFRVMGETANECIKIIENFIKDNPHGDEVIISWYELKKIIYRKLKDNEQVRNRMIKYRQKSGT